MATRKFTETELVIATHNRGKMEEFRAMFAQAPLPRPRYGGGRGSGVSPDVQLHLRPRNMPPVSNTSHLDQPKTWGERIKFLSLDDFKLPPPDETGTTFIENATIKALHAALATERPALADDSGLCVNALNGDPGVYSADWAEITKGGTRDFDMAMRKIHDALAGKADRSAAFVCCLVLAWPDGHTESVEGRIPGTIVWPPSGENGFGYDPIFRPQGQVLTYAEIDREVKNADSHRARAFRMLLSKCF